MNSEDSETQNARQVVPDSVREISQTLDVTGKLFVFVSFFVFGLGLIGNDKVSGAACVLGPVFLVMGIFDVFLAREFGRLQKWTYPIVKLQVGSAWGLGAALLDGYPQKIRSPEVRKAFGLDPLPSEEQQPPQ